MLACYQMPATSFLPASLAVLPAAQKMDGDQQGLAPHPLDAKLASRWHSCWCWLLGKVHTRPGSRVTTESATVPREALELVLHLRRMSKATADLNEVKDTTLLLNSSSVTSLFPALSRVDLLPWERDLSCVIFSDQSGALGDPHLLKSKVLTKTYAHTF